MSDFNEFEENLIRNLDSIKNKIEVPEPITILKCKEQLAKSRNKKVKLSITVLFLISFLTLSVAAVQNIGNISLFKGLYDPTLENSNVESVSKQTDYNVENNGIKLSVKNVLADGVRIVLTLEESGKASESGLPSFEQVTLTDLTGQEYLMVKHGGGHPLQKPDKKPESTSLEFKGSPLNDTKLALEVKCINGVSGYWKIVFPVSVVKYENLLINKNYTQNSLDISIKNIVFSTSCVELNGDYNNSDYYVGGAELSNGTNVVGTIQIVQEAIPNKSSFNLRFATLSKTEKMALKLKLISKSNNKEKLITINIF